MVLVAVGLLAMLVSPRPAAAALTHDLKVEISGPARVTVGDTFTYAVTVTNKAESQTEELSAIVTVAVPAGLSVKSAEGCTVRPGGAVACTVGLEKRGDSKTIDIVVTADLAGTFTTTADVANFQGGSFVDADPSDNYDSSTTTVAGEGQGPQASSLSIDGVSVSEGKAGTTTNATFTVKLTPPATAPVTVDYATADDIAIAPSDYASTTGRLTFVTGQSEQRLSVVVAGDDQYEGDEGFFANLSNPTNATIADGQGTGTIVDDDPLPSLSIDDVVVSEGSEATFTVSLSAPNGVPADVRYATQDGTAAAPGDYEPATGTLTFAPGQTSQTMEVKANDDAAVEGDEIFFVKLSNPTNATIADGQGQATIADGAVPPSLSIDDVSATEGNTGSTTNATFTVSRRGDASQPVSVNYATTDGSASSPSDYGAQSGILAFAAGERTAMVSVAVVVDNVPEGDETFFVNLSQASLGSTISDPQGMGTIVDDDGAATLSIDDISADEGPLGGRKAATFTVTLSSPNPLPVSVDYATADGIATTPADYAATTGRLTFAPGQTSQSLAVTVEGDEIFEGDEHFFVNLSNPSGASIADGQGKATIRDDDVAPIIFIDDVSVSEGKAGTTTDATFTVTMGGGATSPVTVTYRTKDGTATAPADYTAGSGTLTFAPGQSRSQSVVVKINGDNVEEDNETFVVELSGATGATISRAQGTGTISDYGGGSWKKVPNPLNQVFGNLTVLEGPACQIGTPPATCGSVLRADGGPLLTLEDDSQVNAFNPETDTWDDTFSTLAYHTTGGATTALGDGTVLEVGGAVCRLGGSNGLGYTCVPGDLGYGKYAQVYDPGVTYSRPVVKKDPPSTTEVTAHGRWRETGQMNFARTGHTATLLKNGKVLIVGGSYISQAQCNLCVGPDPGATAELYDPVSGTFTPALTPADPHAGHSPVLLPDGRVLVVGGNDKPYGEIYDPAANGGLGGWTKTATGIRHGYLPTTTLLKDGNVLVVGGLPAGDNASGQATAAAKLYNPSLDTWTDVPDIPLARWNHSAILLRSGKVLVAGGRPCGAAASCEALTDARLFEPGTLTWRRAAPMNLPHYGADAVHLRSGNGTCERVMVGGTNSETNTSGVFSVSEIYTPVDQVCEITTPIDDGGDKDDDGGPPESEPLTDNVPQEPPAPIPPQSQVQVQPPQAQTQPQSQPQPQTQPQTQTQTQTQPQTQPQTQNQLQTQTQTQIQTQIQPQPQTQTQNQVQTQNQLQSESVQHAQAAIMRNRQGQHQVETEGVGDGLSDGQSSSQEWLASARRPSPIVPLALSWGAAMAMVAMGVGARLRTNKRPAQARARPLPSSWPRRR